MYLFKGAISVPKEVSDCLPPSSSCINSPQLASSCG
jgi:hypothetical protein